MATAIDQIMDERQRQLEFWCPQFDDLNTPNDWAAYIIRYVAEGAYDGRAGTYTPERFKEYLVKAGAIVVAAIEQLDERGMAPRHWEEGV